MLGESRHLQMQQRWFTSKSSQNEIETDAFTVRKYMFKNWPHCTSKDAKGKLTLDLPHAKPTRKQAGGGREGD